MKGKNRKRRQVRSAMIKGQPPKGRGSMDENKPKETAYTRERIKLATMEGPPVAKEEVVSPSEESVDAAAAAESQAEAREIAKSLAGQAGEESPKPSRYAPVTISPEMAKRESTPVTEFVEFLKQTKRVWLIVVGAIFGLFVVVTLVNRASQWAANSRERRHEQAVASVTPERLITRCGQPAEDVTNNAYPILMRTMTYPIGRNEGYVFEFSRTAEEKSDWVFLSMKDASGAKSYDTPDAQIAAMSCLDSRK